jgi:hypothetical protein
MSVRESFAWAGIGRTAVYAELKSGRFQAKNCGPRTLITLQDAQQVLDRLPSESPSQTDKTPEPPQANKAQLTLIFRRMN